ncbi:PH domain-containing protein [Kitasatospora sp. NPDC056783]|uniref:PH domain-containing protein n=1 Tax=Kitasatospora sp. NPDC056783 TaxID=3345943 RepID=UPI0036AD043F
MSGEQVLMKGRLHPVTPWRRTWAAATGAVTFLFRDMHDWIDLVVDLPAWVLALTAGLVTLLAASYGFTSWLRTSWQLTPQALQVHSGILFHRHRRFELAHVQEVDVHRPLLGRLIGVCTLRVSVAGRSADLAYLGMVQAQALRTEMRRHMAASAEPAHRQAARPDDAREILSVPARMLGLSILLDAHTMAHVAAALALGAVPYLVLGEPLALLSLAGSLGWAWKLTAGRWPAWHGWTVTAHRSGYRVDHGLFNHRHSTLRHERIQAVVLTQPVLWRRRDWVRISLAVPGHRGLAMLAPVATRRQAEELVEGLWGEEAVEVVRAQCPTPRRARWATLRSRMLSAVVRPGFAAVWRGLFLRSVVHVWPAAKVQQVEVVQGPWQRRLGLATVEIALAGGPNPAARHRDVIEAAHLAEQLRARSGRGPEVPVAVSDE